MADAPIEVETDPTDDRVRHVRLARPDRHNVLDRALLADLLDALDRADRDPDVGAIVLGTTGAVFCAGADLEELAGLGFEAGGRWLTGYLEAVDLLRATGKPAVAAVEGACVAGGNELAMACDLVVAGESARFGQPEALVGSTAGGGGAQLLPLVVGEKRARELLLTGALLDAAEAERVGLINRVVPDGGAARAAVDLAGTVLDRTSPQAYRTIKALLDRWAELGMLGRGLARDATARVWDSPEFRDRAAAFIAGEDQDPRAFTGVRFDRGDG